MTNHHRQFSVAALKIEFGFQRLVVLNDFTALALALPALEARDVRQVGRGASVLSPAIGLIGPGTGLGVSGLVPDQRSGWVPLQGKSGHVSLPSSNPREQAVLAQMAAQHGHVSEEPAVSGHGLSNTRYASSTVRHAIGWRRTMSRMARSQPGSRAAVRK